MTSFDDWQTETDRQQLGSVGDGFRIETLEQAEWAMRLRAAAETRLAEIEASRRREQHRIDTWADETAGPVRNEATKYEAWLEDFHRRRYAVNPDEKKTLNLPAGKIVRSESKSLKARIMDAETVLAWALNEAPELIATKETVSAKAVTDHVRATGQKMPGVEIVEPGTVTYSVTVNKGESVD